MMNWGVGILHSAFLVFRKNIPMRTRLMALLSVLCTAYFLFLTSLATYITWNDVVPKLYGNDLPKVRFHKLLMSFLFFNVMGNYILTLFTDTTVWRYKDGVPKDKIPRGSHQCEKCQLVKPPRSHHCVVCETCILKRDHHCVIMTVCIGYFNQKYFVMYCFYLMSGTFYAVVLVLRYLNLKYGVTFDGPQTFVTLLLDVILRILQKDQPKPKYLFFINLLYASLGSGLLALWLLIKQLRIIRTGQTDHERKFGITKYSSSSLAQNVKAVFGKYWYLNLLLPVPLPQLSDGQYIPQGKKKIQ